MDIRITEAVARLKERLAELEAMPGLADLSESQAGDVADQLERTGDEMVSTLSLVDPEYYAGDETPESDDVRTAAA